MTEKKSQQVSHLKSYTIAFLVSLLFLGGIISILIIFIRLDLIPQGYLPLILLTLPLTPLFVMWLYFLYRALIPITGGMPAKGFKQWALAYSLVLYFLLYWALWAFIFDMTIPSIDYEYREAILPLVVFIVTQLALQRSTRYRQFMNRIFKTSNSKELKRALRRTLCEL